MARCIAHIALAPAALLLEWFRGLAETAATENAEFGWLIAAKLAAGLLAGALLCVCLSGRPCRPAWHIASLALLALLLAAAYLLPTFVHYVVRGPELAACFVAAEVFSLYRAIRKTKEETI